MRMKLFVICLDHVEYFHGPFVLPFLTFIEGDNYLGFVVELMMMNARQFDDAFVVDYERRGLDNCKNMIRGFNVSLTKQSCNKFLSVFSIPYFLFGRFTFCFNRQRYKLAVGFIFAAIIDIECVSILIKKAPIEKVANKKARTRMPVATPRICELKR